MAIDKIYEGKTRNEIIELVYTFHLQNTNGRESHDEMFKLGIKACYEELCVSECSDENAALPIHSVSNIPDYTLVWNVVDYLCTSKRISNDAKLEVFKALTKLESEGKCTMGDLPSDVY